MKTNKIILFISIIVTLSIASCSNQNVSNNQNGKQQVEYTCPMHPEVVSDKPGSCPKCGMDLVIKDTSSDTVNQMHGDSMKSMKHE